MLILCSVHLPGSAPVSLPSPLIIFERDPMKKRETMPSFCNRLQLFLKRKLNGAWYDEEASTQKESAIKMFAPSHAAQALYWKRKKT